MKRPSQVIVLGEKYKIKLIKDLKSKGICGECDFDKKIISIDSSLKKDDYWSTLIHEIGHAIFNEASINQAISHDLEEVIVDLFSRVMTKNKLVI